VTDQLPVLVIEHEAQCPPGWIGEWLEEAGRQLDVRRPYRGDPLPDDLRGHAGLVVLGGEMGVYDDAAYPWLSHVKTLLVESDPAGPPVLGICLGLQLAAVALGGEVRVNPLGQQIGVLDIGWTEAAPGDLLLGELALREGVPAVQWNCDVVTQLPAGAVALARTPRGELQAARLAPHVWGVQWHPEAGVDIIAPWAEHDRDAAAARGVDLDGYVQDVADATEALREAWRELALRFAELVHDPSVAAGRR